MQIPLKEKEGDTYRVILRTHERNLFKKFTTLFRLNKCQKIYPRLRNQIHHKVCKVCQKKTIHTPNGVSCKLVKLAQQVKILVLPSEVCGRLGKGCGGC